MWVNQKCIFYILLSASAPSGRYIDSVIQLNFFSTYSKRSQHAKQRSWISYEQKETPTENTFETKPWSLL